MTAKRPTIPDLAAAAGVSVSTVNRVLNQPDSVRLPTRERVLNAAEAIGFYGLGTIQHAVRAGRDTISMGILLLQEGRRFYRNLGLALQREAERVSDGSVDLRLEFLDDLSPSEVAQRLEALGETCEVVALVGAQHPLLADAIDALIDRGVPVVGLIAPLTARGNVSYVGLDNWKVGRTAAWAFAKGRKPVLADSFPKPVEPKLDRGLVFGSMLFGAGWALVGLCPGPALASLSYGGWGHWVFMAAMLAGMGLAVPVRARIDLTA